MDVDVQCRSQCPWLLEGVFAAWSEKINVSARHSSFLKEHILISCGFFLFQLFYYLTTQMLIEQTPKRNIAVLYVF